MMAGCDSLVEYLYEAGGPRPHKCGYCKCPDSSYTRGVWGYKMTCCDYQKLVDCGFQRSGRYVYQPEMKRTCCPQYVIRLDVKSFKLSKSQRSSIKKFKRYLVEGNTPVDTRKEELAGDATETDEDSVPMVAANPISGVGESSCSKKSDSATGLPKMKKTVTPGTGPDLNKPPCKKAKLIRKERREKKLLDRAATVVSQTSSQSAVVTQHSGDDVFCQHLEDILTFPKDDCVHKFQTKLVRIDSRDFTDSYEESFQVFKKFQMIIHKESENDCGKKQFNEFLAYTPLQYKEGTNNMTTNFGTYHQQYLLDGKIFAVGVLDILPKGVLCEYLYYDPDYRFIAPGVITALLEIELAQMFYLQNSEMQHYYMGFYVQSCAKMNYKRRYSASKLLCPETYTYVPLEKCITKLMASAYSRLAEDDVENPHQEYDMGCVPVLADSTVMLYASYTTLHGNHADDLIKEYIELVGIDIAFNMTLYLGRS